jgi:uroporphyrinogen decarboxylase
MASMSHSERVLAAISREEPDRVPVDLGSTRATTMIIASYENLKKHLGLNHETKLMWKYQNSVVPDESILRRLDIDTRLLLLGDFKKKPAKIISADSFIDVWGTTWKKTPEGHFINAEGPFQSCEPDIKILEAFDWPDPDDPGIYEGLREKAESLRKSTDCAIVLDLPNGIMLQGWFVRGFAEWLTDLYMNKEFAARLMDIMTDIWTKIVARALEIVGRNIDIVAMADDLGMQEGTFVSPQVYREMLKPRHKRMVDAIKSRSDAKIFLHSCGSVYAIIQDLIEIGIDVLNPVQVAAKNMEPERLKKEFGDRLAFWGAIDTQHVLPFGTPDEVRAEVRRVIDCLGKGGGYIVASVHNLQREVPPENIIAMFDEARSHGRYQR